MSSNKKRKPSTACLAAEAPDPSAPAPALEAEVLQPVHDDPARDWALWLPQAKKGASGKEAAAGRSIWVLRRMGPDLVVGYTREQEQAHSATFKSIHPEVRFFRRDVGRERDRDKEDTRASSSSSSSGARSGAAEDSTAAAATRPPSTTLADALDRDREMDWGNYVNGMDWTGLDHVRDVLRLRTEFVTKILYFPDLDMARGLTPEQHAGLSHTELFLAAECQYVGNNVRKLPAETSEYVHENEAEPALDTDLPIDS
jgi:hypothetical protein